MLKRLQAAKADPALQRDKQLDEFNNSKLFGVALGSVHPSARKMHSGGAGLHSSSYSSLDASYHTYSRPSSAKSGGSRPPSAKLTVSRPSSAKSDKPGSSRPQSGRPKPKPAWDDRW